MNERVLRPMYYANHPEYKWETQSQCANVNWV